VSEILKKNKNKKEIKKEIKIKEDRRGRFKRQSKIAVSSKRE